MLRNLTILERLATDADAALAVEGRPAVTANQERHRNQHRAEEEGDPERADHVERAFEDPLGAAEDRRFDVEQGKAGDRPGEDSRAGHLGETWSQDQVDARSLEIPSQSPQTVGAETRGAGAGHHVRSDAKSDGDSVLLTTKDRHTADRLVAVRAAGTDDAIPGGGTSLSAATRLVR